MSEAIPNCCRECRYAVDKVFYLPGVSKDNPACSKDDTTRSIKTHYKQSKKPIWCPLESRNRTI